MAPRWNNKKERNWNSNLANLVTFLEILPTKKVSDLTFKGLQIFKSQLFSFSRHNGTRNNLGKKKEDCWQYKFKQGLDLGVDGKRDMQKEWAQVDYTNGNGNWTTFYWNLAHTIILKGMLQAATLGLLLVCHLN